MRLLKVTKIVSLSKVSLLKNFWFLFIGIIPNNFHNFQKKFKSDTFKNYKSFVPVEVQSQRLSNIFLKYVLMKKHWHNELKLGEKCNFVGQSTEIFSSNAKIKNLKSFLIEAVGAVTKGPIGYGKNFKKCW